MGSVTSCRSSSKFGWPSRWPTLDFWLVKKLSRQMTSWPSVDEPFAEVRAEEPGPAGNEDAFDGCHYAASIA